MATRGPTTHTLECLECGALSPDDPALRGWQAYLYARSDAKVARELAFFCPVCASFVVDEQSV
jgi:ribosomal protein S26